MPLAKNDYVSDIWKDGIFGIPLIFVSFTLYSLQRFVDNKVVFCTGGAGSICSAQVRAMVHLGANACIVGRNVGKTERMAKEIATARKGSKVLGFGSIDVRAVESLQDAVEKCVKELGGIDFVM